MSPANKTRITSNVKCYRTLSKKEDSFTFIYNNKYILILKNIGKEFTLVMSAEKKMIKKPKNKFTKKIVFDDALSEMIKISNTQSSISKIDHDSLEMVAIFIEKINAEMNKGNLTIDPSVLDPNNFQNAVDNMKTKSDYVIPPVPAAPPLARPVINYQADDSLDKIEVDFKDGLKNL